MRSQDFAQGSCDLLVVKDLSRTQIMNEILGVILFIKWEKVKNEKYLPRNKVFFKLEDFFVI